MSDSPDHKQDTQEEVKASSQKPSGGLSRRGARGGIASGRAQTGPVYRKKEATISAPDTTNNNESAQNLPEEIKQPRKSLQPEGGRKHYEKKANN